jgi:hypothetical protein
LRSTLSGEDVASVTLGILLWDPASRESDDDYEGTAHVWLDVAGRPVDNAYVEIPDPAYAELTHTAKREEFYAREDPFKSGGRRLYLGQEDTLNETVRHNLRVFKEYGNDANVEKYVVFAFSCAQLNPSVLMYHMLMRDLLKERLGVEAEDLEAKWAGRCWKCGKAPGAETELKTCTSCGKGKYCDRNCQQDDWKAHKLLHKELALTKEIYKQQEEDLE